MADAPDGRIVSTNPAFTALIGREIDRSAPVERYPELLGLTRPTGESYRVEELPWVRSIRSGEEVSSEEMMVRRPDGTAMAVLCSASPVPLEHNGVAGAVALLQDVSERKELERQKDEFLAVVAHELRTPLTAIKGHSQVVLMRARGAAGTGLDPRTVSALEAIARQADRLGGLANDLLDLSRIQMGTLEISKTRFDEGHLANGVVAQMQAAVPQRRFQLDISGNTEVVADAARVEQVLFNLLSNAVKATEEGGLVEVRIERWDSSVVASVQDHGRGMPEEVQKRVFERLYRGGAVGGGMGLGLYISQRIAEDHGGRIWFESREGKGTTFHFSLPAAGSQERRSPR